MIEREKIEGLVAQELEEANRIYPLFHSPHEGYAVLKEEVEEMVFETQCATAGLELIWDRVKADQDIYGLVKVLHYHAIHTIQEAIQVAAMCDKIIQSELYEEK